MQESATESSSIMSTSSKRRVKKVKRVKVRREKSDLDLTNQELSNNSNPDVQPQLEQIEQYSEHNSPQSVIQDLGSAQHLIEQELIFIPKQTDVKQPDTNQEEPAILSDSNPRMVSSDHNSQTQKTLTQPTYPQVNSVTPKQKQPTSQVQSAKRSIPCFDDTIPVPKAEPAVSKPKSQPKPQLVQNAQPQLSMVQKSLQQKEEERKQRNSMLLSKKYEYKNVEQTPYTPNRFGKTSYKNLEQHAQPTKTTIYNPHHTQTDVITKIQYSIEQEQKRQAELKQRIAKIADPDREIELHDQEQALLAEIREAEKKLSKLTNQFKSIDAKQTAIIKNKDKNYDVDFIRQQIRDSNQIYISKRDKLQKINNELVQYQKRSEIFEGLVPLLHERLETGCEENNLQSLIEFFKEIQQKELVQRPQSEQVDQLYDEQLKELKRLQEIHETGMRALEKQAEVNSREETKLQKEIEKMEAKRDEFVKEYEILYEKYQKIAE
ncbi:Conserved_hypothetical protein [Hexamita inflata]|uniref:Uncharacterized protein n=1 Tax=Hexamita inflata TaxID=28002 RepID=A0AA86U6S6_9EUKA|nr:Conserved hypothetical protein [Hexamita inflata]